MNCPIDNNALVMSDRSGVEIDYCPQCRGVWLDRGELDKIIERASSQSAPAQQAAPPAQHYQNAPSGYPQQSYPQRGYPQKRKNWLSEIFD